MATATGTPPSSDRLRWLRPLEAHQPLFALVDTARDRRIYPILRAAGPQVGSLYAMPAARELATVAPYLASVLPGFGVGRQLLEGGWGDGWATWLTTAADADTVLRHVRQFLSVRRPDGRELFFRFYDPRVLRRYLPTCTPDEAERFFGPITSFVIEAPDPSYCVRFTADRDGVRAEVLAPDGLTQAGRRLVRPPAPPPLLRTPTVQVVAIPPAAAASDPAGTGSAAPPNGTQTRATKAEPALPTMPAQPPVSDPMSGTGTAIPVSSRDRTSPDASAAAVDDATAGGDATSKAEIKECQDSPAEPDEFQTEVDGVGHPAPAEADEQPRPSDAVGLAPDTFQAREIRPTEGGSGEADDLGGATLAHHSVEPKFEPASEQAHGPAVSHAEMPAAGDTAEVLAESDPHVSPPDSSNGVPEVVEKPVVGVPAPRDPEDALWPSPSDARTTDADPDVFDSVMNGQDEVPVGHADVRADEPKAPHPPAVAVQAMTVGDAVAAGGPSPIPVTPPVPAVQVDPWYDPDDEVWDEALAPRPAWRWPPPPPDH